MNRRFAKMACGLIITVLMLAMAGCGQAAEEETYTEDQAETTDVTEGEYDIAADMTVTEEELSDGQTAQVMDTDHFTLTLIPAGAWTFEMNDEDSISIYDIESRDGGFGGHLMTIMAYDKGDTDYEQLPSYAVAGESVDKVYIVEYPSDVQFDPENNTTYMPMFEQLQKIQDGGEDSPLVLK